MEPFNPALARVYTVPEVAMMLRCDRTTVYSLIREGHLDVVRVGRVFRITQKAVDEFLGEE